MRNPLRRNRPAAWGAPDDPTHEARALSTWQGGLAGYNIIDPLAIPPPGMGLNRNWAGVTITEKTALQMDAVMTAMRVLTNGMIELGAPYAYTEALDDANWPYRKRLANQPAFLSNTFGMAPTGNIEQPQYIGTEMTVISMALWGTAWWLSVERSNGYTTAVEVLNPALLECQKDSGGNPRYLYGVGSSRVELNPQFLYHIPNKVLPGGGPGLSALDFAGLPMAIALAAMEYGARWFSQGMSPGYILTTDQKLGQDEVERIVQTLLIQHGGSTQAHLPMLVDSGVKPQKSQNTPDEAQYLDTLEYCRNCVGAYFGIPSSLLGNARMRQTPEPPHSIGEEMMRMVTWTLSGYINPLEALYTALLPGKTKVAFDRAKILQTDAQSFAALVLNPRQTNSISINEVRSRYLGLPPVDGGDEVIAPLASNTSPDQTTNPGDDAPPEKAPLSNEPEPGGNE